MRLNRSSLVSGTSASLDLRVKFFDLGLIILIGRAPLFGSRLARVVRAFPLVVIGEHFTIVRKRRSSSAVAMTYLWFNAMSLIVRP